MRTSRKVAVIVGLSVAFFASLSSPGRALADEVLRAKLRGFSEVPAISTAAKGEFRGKISEDETAIDYEESYEGLEGTVTQSHIHFGQRGVSAGITVWLCQTATNPAPASVAAITPFCPTSPGTVSGTVTAANVIGPVGQGISATEFAELLRAIRAGITYANVHSRDAGGVATNFNAGEIRGQIKAFRHHDRDHDRDED